MWRWLSRINGVATKWGHHFFRNVFTNNTWQVLYNFKAMPGQVWYTDVKGGGVNNIFTYKTTVLSKTTITVNTIALKRMTITSQINGSAFTSTSIITERYGSDQFMFNYDPNGGFCDVQWFEHKLCYTDNQMGTVQFSSYPCNYSTVGFKNDKSINNLDVELYPNPFNQTLNIDMDEGISREIITLKITDMLGRELLSKELEQHNKLDLKELNRGVYLINIYSETQLLGTKKIIGE